MGVMATTEIAAMRTTGGGHGMTIVVTGAGVANRRILTDAMVEITTEIVGGAVAEIAVMLTGAEVIVVTPTAATLAIDKTGAASGMTRNIAGVISKDTVRFWLDFECDVR